MPAVYELTTLEIKVFSNAKVYEALQRSLPNAGGTLVGAFASDIGELSQVLLLRRFDNADALADARLAMLMAENPLGCGEWLVKLQSQSFALFPFLADPQPAHGGHVGFPGGAWPPGHVLTLPEAVMGWVAAQS